MHPSANDHSSWHEAWMLARWGVFELVLLRMLNFTGDYLYRGTRARSVGDVEPVPWA